MISDTERAELANQGWKADPDRDAISKAFKFRNFVEAFGWMTKIALWLIFLKSWPKHL